MQQYAVGIFPQVAWDIAVHVSNVEDNNRIQAGAAYDEEKKVALVNMIAFGFKVQFQVSGEAHELHAVSFAVERARETLRALTGREVPLMIIAPNDAISARPITPDAPVQVEPPVAEEPATSEANEAKDDQVSTL